MLRSIGVVIKLYRYKGYIPYSPPGFLQIPDWSWFQNLPINLFYCLRSHCSDVVKLSREKDISLDPSVFNLILLVEFCRRSFSTLGTVPLGPLGPPRPPGQRWFHEFVCIPTGSNAPLLLSSSSTVLFVNDKWSEPKTFPATADPKPLFFTLPQLLFRSHGIRSPKLKDKYKYKYTNTWINTNSNIDTHIQCHMVDLKNIPSWVLKAFLNLTAAILFSHRIWSQKFKYKYKYNDK